MSEPKLIIKEESSAKKTRSPPKKPKVEQSVPRKKKLKTDADKAAEREDRKSTRLNSSHRSQSRMPSSA